MTKVIGTYKGMSVIEANDSKTLKEIQEKMEGIAPPFAVKISGKRIGDEAFVYCTDIAAIFIPDSVTDIGKMAFAGCTRLTSINIPDSVSTIDSEAFRSCTGLTSVNIGNLGISRVVHCLCQGNQNQESKIIGTGSSDPQRTNVPVLLARRLPRLPHMCIFAGERINRSA